MPMGTSSPDAGNRRETERRGVTAHVEAPLSRRMAIGGVAFFGAAMSAFGSRAFAQAGPHGSYGNAAIAGESAGGASGKSDDDIVRAVKIARAMRSGPAQITREATVVEMDHHGNVASVLRKGTNGWICMPGDENVIGAGFGHAAAGCSALAACYLWEVAIARSHADPFKSRHSSHAGQKGDISERQRMAQSGHSPKR